MPQEDVGTAHGAKNQGDGVGGQDDDTTHDGGEDLPGLAVDDRSCEV
jgi:hypothetical protein